MSPFLKAQILAEARATSSETRRSALAQAWWVPLGSSAVAALLFLGLSGMRHGEGRPPWLFLASSLGWTAIATLSLWGALERGGSALGRSRSWLLAVTAGTPLVLLAMMLAFAVARPEITTLHPERIGLRCLSLALVASAFPLVALSLLRQGSDPVHPVASGAALGAASGAVGGILVILWCPVASPAHVLVGHIAPMLLTAVVGAWLGSRVIAMRPITRVR